MTKTKIEIDTEPIKLDALKVYLGKKNTTIEVELSRYLDALYSKNVPAIVREYIRSSLENKKNEGRSEAAEDPFKV